MSYIITCRDKAVSWEKTLGKYGIYNISIENIDKTKLKIDESYQRSHKDASINKIVKEFNPVLVGTLVVAHRLDDGNYYVVDGQHRLLAAMKIPEITTLPCEVFESSGSKEESDLYIKLNCSRKKPSSMQLFKALLATGDERALSVQKVISRNHFKTTNHTAKDLKLCNCIGTALWVYDNFGIDAFDKTMGIMDKLYPNNPIESSILSGVGNIIGRYVIPDYDRFTKAILDIGREELFRELKNYCIVVNRRGEATYSESISIQVNTKIGKRSKKYHIYRSDKKVEE